MEQIPVSMLVPGLTIELTGKQKLWDFTKVPWRELLPPAKLRVLEVSRMPTGASSPRVPYELVLQTDDGTRIALEVLDVADLVAIVQSA